MKKLLCITLALILTLTACTTPTNTTSSDISSSQEDNVLRDYASSQEALDFVKRIAPFTATINYETIDYVDALIYPWELIYALHEEMSAIGVPDENSEIKLQSIKVYELIAKYFGSSAVPTECTKSTNSFFTISEPSTKWAVLWTVLSVELSEFSGKEAVYTVNLKHPYTDYTYVAQMHFLVLSENSETWLQLTSNTFSVKDKKEFTLEDNAAVLASLIAVSIKPSFYDADTITSLYVGNSVISNFMTNAAFSYYRADFAYSDCFRMDFTGDYYFSKESALKIIYEVFGKENFDTKNVYWSFWYKETTDEFTDTTHFGTTPPAKVLEVTTLSDSTIVVKVQGVKKIQALQFEPIKDSDSRTFLRLI